MGPEVIWTLCIIDITRRYFKHSQWRNALDKDTFEAVTVSLLEFDIFVSTFLQTEVLSNKNKKSLSGIISAL